MDRGVKNYGQKEKKCCNKCMYYNAEETEISALCIFHMLTVFDFNFCSDFLKKF